MTKDLEKEILERLANLEVSYRVLRDRKEPTITFANGVPMEPDAGYSYVGGTRIENVPLSKLVYLVMLRLGLKLDVQDAQPKKVSLK